MKRLKAEAKSFFKADADVQLPPILTGADHDMIVDLAEQSYATFDRLQAAIETLAQRQEEGREAAIRENEAQIAQVEATTKTRSDLEKELERALKREREKEEEMERLKEEHARELDQLKKEHSRDLEQLKKE